LVWGDFCRSRLNYHRPVFPPHVVFSACPTFPLAAPRKCLIMNYRGPYGPHRSSFLLRPPYKTFPLPSGNSTRLFFPRFFEKDVGNCQVTFPLLCLLSLWVFCDKSHYFLKFLHVLCLFFPPPGLMPKRALHVPRSRDQCPFDRCPCLPCSLFLLPPPLPASLSLLIIGRLKDSDFPSHCPPPSTIFGLRPQTFMFFASGWFG